MDIGKHHIVIIDGHNFMHRSRAGLQVGDHHIVFNFFRSLRALLEKLNPTRVCFVLEGRPVERLAEFADYKANRQISEDDPDREAKVAVMEDFHRQKRIIVDLLTNNFPVSVMRHSQHECDDVIYNIVRSSSRAVDFTIVSNDSDFTQMLNEFANVRIYNPMKKEYVATPEFDYVTWKSLRGDGSDNIDGIPGVGDKTALKLVNDPDALEELLKRDTETSERFAKNVKLIRFKTFSREEMLEVTSSRPNRDWTAVKGRFNDFKFKSITDDKPWNKFVTTFDPLFGE